MSTLNDLNKFIAPAEKAFNLVINDERPLKIINAFENKSAAILKLPNYKNTYVYVVKYLKEDISKYLTESQEALNFYYTVEDKRTGKNARELKEIKKLVDKNLYKRYAVVSKIAGNFPIIKPNEILEDPEKYRQEIQMFSSGVLKLTGNQQVDMVIAKYYSEIANLVGFEVFSKEKIELLLNENQPQQKPVENSVSSSPIFKLLYVLNPSSFTSL